MKRSLRPLRARATLAPQLPKILSAGPSQHLLSTARSVEAGGVRTGSLRMRVQGCWHEPLLLVPGPAVRLEAGRFASLCSSFHHLQNRDTNDGHLNRGI